MNHRNFSRVFHYRTAQRTSADVFSSSLQLFKGKTLTFNGQQVKLAKRLRKRLREGILWIE